MTMASAECSSSAAGSSSSAAGNSSMRKFSAEAMKQQQ